jgi:hypothetical protein
MHQALVGQHFEQALKIIYARSSYVTNIIHAIESICMPALMQKHHYLEIGPVEGVITQEIGKHFTKTSVAEANAQFMKHFSDRYHVYHQPWDEIQETIQADLILCAHRLYHLESSQWSQSVKHIYQSLAPGGIAMIVLLAPRGYKHDLYQTLNPNYLHAEQLYKTLDKLGIEYKSQPNKIVLTTQTYQEMYELCRFMVYKDVLRGDIIQQYSEEEMIEVEKMITRFAKARETVRKNFQLVQEEDWIFLHKPTLP